jgi:transposase
MQYLKGKHSLSWGAQYQWLDDNDSPLLKEAEANPEARYLMQHQPGVGPITALTVVLTLGPVERFASARKVASYAGLIPAEYSTGARQKLGHISKQGNPFLRWVLVESATVAVRHDPEMKRMCWRLVERRGKPIAKVAMARKLLTRLYWMLRRRSEASRGLRQRNRVAGKLEN